MVKETKVAPPLPRNVVPPLTRQLTTRSPPEMAHPNTKTSSIIKAGKKHHVLAPKSTNLSTSSLKSSGSNKASRPKSLFSIFSAPLETPSITVTPLDSPTETINYPFLKKVLRELLLLPEQRVEMKEKTCQLLCYKAAPEGMSDVFEVRIYFQLSLAKTFHLSVSVLPKHVARRSVVFRIEQQLGSDEGKWPVAFQWSEEIPDRYTKNYLNEWEEFYDLEGDEIEEDEEFATFVWKITFAAKR